MGCGDDDGSSTGGAGSGGTAGDGTGAAGGMGAQGGSGATSSGGSGSSLDLSECATSADCPSGECVELHDGYRVCRELVGETTTCTGSALDQCCNTSECTSPAICVETPVTAFCGGAVQETHNVCATDECANNDDCLEGSICAPQGTVGNKVAICLLAECSGVCGQESLSPCALVRDPCCEAPIGFFCIPEDGCHTNADCEDGYCEMGVCKSGAPPCPG